MVEVATRQETLIEIRDLKTCFETADGMVSAVNGIDLQIYRGKSLGLVGESGCGKSVTALSIMRLISKPGRISCGKIFLEGTDLLTLPEEKMRSIRGKKVSMIFQEPMTALNPVLTIGDQVKEAVLAHEHIGKKAAFEKAVEMLKLVGIPSPEKRYKSYPHEFSGGMRQRVMIAMALACQPDLLIADEPTTALDVTIQAQILNLIESLKEKMGMAILLITHDLGVVADVADDVAVMYSGKIIETSNVRKLFANPLHPYTRGLLESIPSLQKDKAEPLNVITGTVPSPLNLPPGCSLAPRCSRVEAQCWQAEPDLRLCNDGHLVRCWLA